MNMWRMILKNINYIKMKGSFTVEAAIIVPIVLFCILWMAEAGIALYTETAEIVQEQKMWEEFHPASQFRRAELLGEVVGMAE